MTHSVTITRRFRGPPRSGNGGYTCGLAARELPAGSVEVGLRVPPPLDRPLEVVHDGGVVRLVDGGRVVAEARPAEAAFGLLPSISFSQATAAAATFDVERYRATHPFPSCFTCGPDRDVGDGLRLFPAPVGDGIVAWAWTPTAADADADGFVPTEVLWAALDCPSGLAWIAGEDWEPAVLGRMTAEVHRRPRVDEELVVCGWRIDRDGRRLRAGSAILARDGREVLAENLGLWVILTDEQRAAFDSQA